MYILIILYNTNGSPSLFSMTLKALALPRFETISLNYQHRCSVGGKDILSSHDGDHDGWMNTWKIK